MKKLSIFFLSLALLAGGGYGLTGCSSSDSIDNPEPEPTEAISAKAVAGDLTPGSATVILTTKGISSYAYVAYTQEEAPAKAPAPAVINAVGTKGNCADGENTVRITTAVSPATGYVVYFVLTTAAGDFYEEVLAVEFTTSDIEGVVSLVQSLSDGLVVNINVPEEIKQANHVLRYTFADWFTYNIRTMGVDALMMIYNAGKFVDKSTTLVLNTENAIDYNEVDENGDPMMFYNLMVPGEPVLFTVGEYGWGNTPAGWSEGYYNYCFDWDRFVNDQNSGVLAVDNSPRSIDVPMSEAKYWTGYYSRNLFYTSKPELMDKKVTVTATNVTTTGFAINFIPDDGVKYYCFYVADEQLYQEYTSLIGGEDLWQWFVTSYGGRWEGCQTVIPQDGEEFAGAAMLPHSEFMYGYPQAGSTYHVMVTAIGSEDGMKQSFTHETFRIPDYTMPAPQVIVTPLSEKSTDEFVYFNVKNANPSVPVVLCKTLCNYDREWSQAGADYATMLANYGIALSADDIAKINTEEGLEFEYSTRPNATTRMAVYVENLEGMANDLSSGTTAVADVRSKPRRDAPRVESALFSDLCGDWTATASVSVWDYALSGYYPKTEPVSTKVTIAGGIDIPETIPAGLANLYPLWSDEALAAMYNEYKEEGALFNHSVRGQNRLLCMGFNFEQIDTFMSRLGLQTPYDLLIHPTYNTPSVANIFYDFGPKWYFQIAESDKITMPINGEEFEPLSNWADRSGYMMAAWAPATEKLLLVNPTATDNNDLTLHFPVEVSADKNRITILPYEYDGDSYYPSVIYIRTNAYASTGTIITSPIVLTRGWSGRSTSAYPTIYESASTSDRIRMGRTSLQDKKITVLKKSPYADEARARMEKLMGR